MLSMCKDEHGKTVLNVTNCDKMNDVKVVVMKNLGLLDFDQHMFGQMPNVEELDISGNCLDNIPESIKLPKLKKLNCAKNKFSDVMFVQQFPSLQEIDFTDNDITFSDFCIASVLCPTLKKFNNQDMDFKELNSKTEDRLKPLINKVWVNHFAPFHDESMSDIDFEAISEKFRIMLKHANVQCTKLTSKFKDFKLLQLIDQFLHDVRSKPGEGWGLTRKYQRNTPGLPSTNKQTMATPTELKHDNTAQKNQIPIMVIVNRDDGTSEAVEATLVVLDEKESETSKEKLDLIKFKSDIIFEDEDVVIASTNEDQQEIGTNVILPESQTSSASSTTAKTTKYWVYDGKSSTVNKSADEDQQEIGTNVILPETQSSSAPSTTAKKIKYWVYDGKPPPVKKKVKPTPKRKPRGCLQKFIVGSVTSASSNINNNINKNPVENTELSLETDDTIKVSPDYSSNKLNVCATVSSTSQKNVKSCVSSGGRKQKRVRFLDDKNDIGEENIRNEMLL